MTAGRREAAGVFAVVGLLLFFILPMVACWLLAQADCAVRSSYARKVLFFAVLGLLISASKNLTAFGIGGCPLDSAIVLSLHDFLVWTVAGVVMAWRVKPKTT